MKLDDIPILDHHAHPLSAPSAVKDAVSFQRWFTESVSPMVYRDQVPETLVFRIALIWLAELLDCEPKVDGILRARARLDQQDWTRRLIQEANIEGVLCDYGFGGKDAYGPGEMASILPCPVKSVLRIETVAEELILASPTFDAFRDAFSARIEAAVCDGHVALKSIVAYRSGLDIEAVSPGTAAREFDRVKEKARRETRIRLESKPLCDHLVHLSLEIAARAGLPVQFHTGFGDRDADLREANPLHLRSVIERFEGAEFVLLHAGWPFHRETAHLAAIYPNVWIDLSLMVPFAGTGIPGVLRGVLGMAPMNKVLLGTDAVGIPERFWVAARWGRWALARVLEEFQGEKLLRDQDCEMVAEMILRGNAHRLYGLADR